MPRPRPAHPQLHPSQAQSPSAATVVLSAGPAGTLKAKAGPCLWAHRGLVTEAAAQTGTFLPCWPTNGSMQNVGAIIAFCPVSVSGSDTTLSGGGEGHVHTGPHQRPGHRRGQHPTPSHPFKCLPEESIEMKEQAPLGTRQIGTQEAERLHRRRDPAQGS